MRHFLLCFFSLCATITMAYAQQKQQNAYIITVTSDTLRGELVKESISKRLKAIKFGHGGDFKVYTTADIKGYGIGDSLYYEPKEVLINSEKRTGFLQVVVNGPTKLYYSRDLSSEGLYYIQKPNEPVILLQREYYRSILNGILNDCDKLVVEQGSALERQNSYAAKSLSNYVQTYNSCRYPADASEVLIVEPKINFRFGMRAGGHHSIVSTLGSNHLYKEYSVKGGTGITAGIFANIDFRNKFSLQPELLYTSRKIEATFNNNELADYSEYAMAEGRYLQIPIMLQYTFGKRTIQPFLKGGVSYGMLINSTTEHLVSYDSGYSYSGNVWLGSKMFGYAIGTGIEHRLKGSQRLLLELRYNHDGMNSSFSRAQTSITTFSVLGGISF